METKCRKYPYHCFNKASALQPHLLEVSVDVEDAVLFRELDVGVDGEVHARPAGAVTEKDDYFRIQKSNEIMSSGA